MIIQLQIKVSCVNGKLQDLRPGAFIMQYPDLIKVDNGKTI